MAFLKNRYSHFKLNLTCINQHCCRAHRYCKLCPQVLKESPFVIELDSEQLLWHHRFVRKVDPCRTQCCLSGIFGTKFENCHNQKHAGHRRIKETLKYCVAVSKVKRSSEYNLIICLCYVIFVSSKGFVLFKIYLC